jgi:molybdate transport system substrate-binding protein
MVGSPLRRALLAAVVLAVAVGGCADDDQTSSAGHAGLSGTVTVLGASSLTDALEAVAAEFEHREGVRVALTFAGSATLATQIVEGVPADVFVSADERNLTRVVDAGRAVGSPRVIATNALEIVVDEGNPLGIARLSDLTGLRLSLCQAEEPCGAYAAEAFARAGLAVPRAAREDSVKGVLTQVQLGEADAGIVYATDVRAAERVSGVDLPAEQQVPAAYPAAVLVDAPNPRAAAAFLAYLMSDEAQTILASLGFGQP